MFNKKLKQKIEGLECHINILKNENSYLFLKNGEKDKEIGENKETIKILSEENKKITEDFNKLLSERNDLMKENKRIDITLSETIIAHNRMARERNIYSFLYDMAEREYGKHFSLSHSLKEKILKEFEEQ